MGPTSKAEFFDAIQAYANSIYKTKLTLKQENPCYEEKKKASEAIHQLFQRLSPADLNIIKDKIRDTIMLRKIQKICNFYDSAYSNDESNLCVKINTWERKGGFENPSATQEIKEQIRMFILKGGSVLSLNSELMDSSLNKVNREIVNTYIEAGVKEHTGSLYEELPSLDLIERLNTFQRNFESVKSNSTYDNMKETKEKLARFVRQVQVEENSSWDEIINNPDLTLGASDYLKRKSQWKVNHS